MSNHVLVIVRMDVAAVAGWTDLEVDRRWLSVYARKYLSDGTPVLPSAAGIAALAQDVALVGLWHSRLVDLGWFMKAFNEPISRCANREDGCTGAFWDGRFHSVRLLDQAALIACMAYGDLNPIRAKSADRPERSEFTSGFRRIRARNRHRAAQNLGARDPAQAQQVQTLVPRFRHEAPPVSAAT